MTENDREALERDFHEAMLGLYRRAKEEVNYNATRSLGMVTERGGLDAATALLDAHEVSDGFTELYLRENRLDLSVEYLVLRDPWRRLFSNEQLAIDRKRLIDRRFAPPPEDGG